MVKFLFVLVLDGFANLMKCVQRDKIYTIVVIQTSHMRLAKLEKVFNVDLVQTQFQNVMFVMVKCQSVLRRDGFVKQVKCVLLVNYSIIVVLQTSHMRLAKLVKVFNVLTFAQTQYRIVMFVMVKHRSVRRRGGFVKQVKCVLLVNYSTIVVLQTSHMRLVKLVKVFNVLTFVQTQCRIVMFAMVKLQLVDRLDGFVNRIKCVLLESSCMDVAQLELLLRSVQLADQLVAQFVLETNQLVMFVWVNN